MKLLNYTTTYFSGILLVLISIWAVVFYFAMFDEIYDSIDDGLDNRKMVLIERASKDIELLQKPQLDEYLYTIEKVNFEKYQNFKDTYRDTMMYMLNEDDFEPVRVLESVFRNNDDYYKIKVVTSMVEEDDQIENLLIYTIILYFSLIISILILNNFFLLKVWKPFYHLISQLKNFSLDSNEPINYKKTNIEEFVLLNKNVEKLLTKTRETYSAQRQFIENASHELQTPLAIAINKLELLFEENNLTENQAFQLQQALENLERLKRLNRSLLLISKIENDQFQQLSNVNINQLIQEIISNFSEMASHKNITFGFSSSENVSLYMNPDLAHFLFSNLIKNAITHGISTSEITINLTEEFFKINNYSSSAPLNGEQIFKRFHKNSMDATSIGLGLAISNSIARKYGFALIYYFREGQHSFALKFH
ncbi:sensor histidine kinase [Aequorivita echinoideorum]|uniref:histidine kinase n=1 Tax=Aequorivita echinoideorum TaxID=1549647 RepID=A0ABS5S589_9FLAO|nr:HAMP domain-containing sensor histidine kinase [Aequorivita echinoideorum]MBT0608368.1 HAMP domain-containing histidine kinase [Aequorivita echinoideorum]